MQRVSLLGAALIASQVGVSSAIFADAVVTPGSYTLAGGQSAEYRVLLGGTLQSFALSFDYVDGSANAWASDLLVQIRDPAGNNSYWGGFNVVPQGATFGGAWSFAGSGSTASGHYEDPSNVSAVTLAGVGVWTVNIWNGWNQGPASGFNNIELTMIGVNDGSLVFGLDPSAGATPLTDEGEPVTDPEQLVFASTTRLGLAADGATRLVLRRRVLDPGQVTFTLSDGAGGSEGLGTLTSLDGTVTGSTLTTETVTTTDGGHYAFAVWYAPTSFVRNEADQALGQRPAVVVGSFSPSGAGQPSERTTTFQIARPPVLLLHSLWSDGRSFVWPIEQDARFRTFSYNYARSSGESLSANRPRVKQAIDQTLELSRSFGIAALRADVIGHGLGGVLARSYVAGRGPIVPKRSSNFFAGDVHALISVHAPHQGSALASLLADAEGTLSWIGEGTRTITGLSQGSAFADLRLESDEVLAPSDAFVPSHAIYGVGGSDLVAMDDVQLAPASVQALRQLVSLAGVESIAFPPGDEHDFFASSESQRGGLFGDQATKTEYVATPPRLGLHATTISEAYTSELVVQLLNTKVESGVYAATFPDTVPTPVDIPAIPTELPLGVAIVAPAEGLIVAPGALLTVTVAPLEGVAPATTLLLGPGGFAFATGEPMTAQFPIPVTALGPVRLQAFTIDQSGVLWQSAPRTLEVVVAGNPQSLVVAPATITFDRAPTTYSLSVYGNYAGGVQRDVTLLGTTYSSNNANVATVDSTGIVRAVGVGTATIKATRGALNVNIPVKVLRLPLPGDVDGDERVGQFDLAEVLGNWGGTGADLDGDGVVGPTDLAIVLGGWT